MASTIKPIFESVSIERDGKRIVLAKIERKPNIMGNKSWHLSQASTPA